MSQYMAVDAWRWFMPTIEIVVIGGGVMESANIIGPTSSPMYANMRGHHGEGSMFVQLTRPTTQLWLEPFLFYPRHAASLDLYALVKEWYRPEMSGHDRV
jgi:hypothetical protein